MSFSSAGLVLLCSVVLFQGQVKGPMWFTRDRTRANGFDPCGDETEAARAPFLRDSFTIDVISYTVQQVVDFANQFFREGKLHQALRCYNKAIRINPSEAKYYRNRGFCFSKMLRPDEAVADFEKSLELEPTSIRGRFFLGRQLYEMERFEESIEHLQKALEYGEERNMMTDERNQVVRMLEIAQQKMITTLERVQQKRIAEQEKKLQKMKEIEDAKRNKAREEELQIYFKRLIMEDLKRQTAALEDRKKYAWDPKFKGDIDNEIRKLLSSRKKYINELTELFVEADQERESMASRQPPDFLCDSISYEMMKEPLCTPSGITYDKTEILKHLETRQTDPMTGLLLRSDQLRENKALKDHIKDYMKKNKLTYIMSTGDGRL